MLRMYTITQKCGASLNFEKKSLIILFTNFIY